MMPMPCNSGMSLSKCCRKSSWIDCLFFPIAGGRAAAQDDAVGGHERVAYPVAGRPDRSVRTPDELERIPAQATLPGDVDGRGRIAETARAFVPVAGEHLRAPSPLHAANAVAQLLGYILEQRYRRLGRQVDSADEALLRIVDRLVVGGNLLVRILRVVLLTEDLEPVDVQLDRVDLTRRCRRL